MFSRHRNEDASHAVGSIQRMSADDPFCPIGKMDAQQLRAALRRENDRITGANIMRARIQWWASSVGVLGFVSIGLMSGFPAIQYLLGPVLVLCTACLVVWRCNAAKPLHREYSSGSADDLDSQEEWEAMARAALLEALKASNRRDQVSRNDSGGYPG